MIKEIQLKDIEQFSNSYNKNFENKKIENKIKKYGLDKVCINKEIIDANPPVFNIELEETKRYNQNDSLRCWAFSGINVIKRDMANNLNIDIMKFELSDNFITFFHRLEKANTAYEEVITAKTTNLRKLFKKPFLKNPVDESGNWQNFVGIVKKYGLVPMEIMPTTIEGKTATKVTNLYTETIRKNLITLAKLKNKNKPIKEIREMKYKMLEENYNFLSKVYGEPSQKFNYKYKNKNGDIISLNNITPNQFVEKFLSIDIENFLFISNIPTWNRKYGQKIKEHQFININKFKYIEYLNISSNELKQLAIKQLKDNIPVMVGICITKFADINSGILDTRLYDYEKLVNYKALSKMEGLSAEDIKLHHWMTITGVQIEEDIPKRWKVEDSYGDKKKINGYYIMNDNFFDKYVFTIIIHKKYLSPKQLKLYNNEGIIEKN